MLIQQCLRGCLSRHACKSLLLLLCMCRVCMVYVVICAWFVVCSVRHCSVLVQNRKACNMQLLWQLVHAVKPACLWCSWLQVGHTIQDRGINGACGGQVLRVDVGLSAGCGNGEVQVRQTASWTHATVKMLSLCDLRNAVQGPHTPCFLPNMREGPLPPQPGYSLPHSLIAPSNVDSFWHCNGQLVFW